MVSEFMIRVVVLVFLFYSMTRVIFECDPGQGCNIVSDDSGRRDWRFRE